MSLRATQFREALEERACPAASNSCHRSRTGGQRSQPWAVVCCATVLISIAAGAGLAQKAPAFTPPEPAFPKLFSKYSGMNGYEDLVTSGDIVSASEAVSAAEQDTATLKQMRAVLEDPNVARALAMAHAGLDKPIQSPRDPDKLDEQTLLPEYIGFRRLARVFAMEEYVALADGRLSKAVEVMRDGLRLGYVVQSETILSGLVGVAINAIALDQFARHFDQMSLKDCGQVMAVAEEWLKLPSTTEVVLAAEHRGMRNTLQGCRNEPDRLKSLVKLMQPKGPPASDSELAAVELSDYVNTNDPGIRAMLDQAEALYEAMYRALIVEIRKPAWQRKPLPKLQSRATIAHRLCDLLSPTYNQVLDRFDMDRARIHLLGAHAAIRRFRWENNRLPSSLAELKRSALTTDPFTGEPLVYKPGAATYELYSAGPPSRVTDGTGVASTIGPIYLPRALVPTAP